MLAKISYSMMNIRTGMKRGSLGLGAGMLRLEAETGDLVSAGIFRSPFRGHFLLWSVCFSGTINLNQKLVTSYEDETHETCAGRFDSSHPIKISSNCIQTATDLSLPGCKGTRMRAQSVFSIMIGLHLALETSRGICAEVWVQTTSSRA